MSNYNAKVFGSFSGYSEEDGSDENGKPTVVKVPFTIGGINTTFSVPQEYRHA